MRRRRRRRNLPFDYFGEHRELLKIALRDELWAHSDALSHEALVLCERLSQSWLDHHEDTVREAWALETERVAGFSARVRPHFDIFVGTLTEALVAYARQGRPDMQWRDHERALYFTPRTPDNKN